MPKKLWLLSALVIVLLLNNSLSENVINPNESATVSGTLDDTSYTKLASYLNEHKEVKRIVFKDCLGGMVNAGFSIIDLIEKNRYDTVAEGKVFSACAYAFLAGKTRTFNKKNRQNLIMLHAGSNITEGSGVAEKFNPYLMQALQIFTHNKIPKTIFHLIEHSHEKSQGIVFINENYWLLHVYQTRYCSGKESGTLEECTIIDSNDPKNYGITEEL